jgi:hypothetical protein
MVDGYRLHFSHAAEQLSKRDRADTAEQLLTTFTEAVPFSTIPGDLQTLFFTARAHRTLGNAEKAASLLKDGEPLVMEELKTAGSRQQFSRALQYAGRIRTSYLKANQRAAREAFDEKIDRVLSQVPFQVPARIRQAYGLAADTSGGLEAPAAMPSPNREGTPSQQPPQPSQPPNNE